MLFRPPINSMSTNVRIPTITTIDAQYNCYIID